MRFSDSDCSWDLVLFHRRPRFSRKICDASLSLLFKETGVTLMQLSVQTLDIRATQNRRNGNLMCEQARFQTREMVYFCAVQACLRERS
jgi:hypothetical protein